MKKLVLFILLIGATCIGANANYVAYQPHINGPVQVSREIKPTICFDNCRPGQIRIPESARNGRRMRQMNGMRHRSMKDRRYVKDYAKPRSKEKCRNSKENIMYRTNRRQAYMKRYSSEEYRQYKASQKPKRVSCLDRCSKCSQTTPQKPIKLNGISYYNVKPF